MKTIKKLKLKLKILGFIFSIVSIFLIFSCEKESKENINDSIPTITNSISVLTPFDMKVQNNIALISFVQSAKLFTIDLSMEDSDKQIAIIKKAIADDIPLKIFVKENTGNIVKIENVSQIEVTRYKSLLFGPEEVKKREASKKATSALTFVSDYNKLNYLFGIVKNQSCGNPSASSPCITFRYAVDGCYARAHKIRQILLSLGYESNKHFVYGNLVASTGACCVKWTYHVASYVYVKNFSGGYDEWIIDPSLFPNGPVSPANWRSACLNTSPLCSATTNFTLPTLYSYPYATYGYVKTSGDVYYYNPSTGKVIYDYPNYANTDATLRAFSNLSGCN
jgi:Glutaminase